MSIRVFKHPAHGDDTIRVVYDGGDGGVYELRQDLLALREVTEVGPDWIELASTEYDPDDDACGDDGATGEATAQGGDRVSSAGAFLCRCDYPASSGQDLDDHVMAMMRVDDGTHHGARRG